MSKQIKKDNPRRVTFDPKGEVNIETLDEIADERDMSRAELIREVLGEFVDEHADEDEAADLYKPDDPELREAFETLLIVSDHPHGPRPVSVETARNRLHTHRCPKSSVKSQLLRPLAERGFISVNDGQIAVHRWTVEQVEQAEAEADDALDRLRGTSGFTDHTPDREREHKMLRKYQRAGIEVPFGLAAWVADRTVWAGPQEADA